MNVPLVQVNVLVASLITKLSWSVYVPPGAFTLKLNPVPQVIPAFAHVCEARLVNVMPTSAPVADAHVTLMDGDKVRLPTISKPAPLESANDQVGLFVTVEKFMVPHL